MRGDMTESRSGPPPVHGSAASAAGRVSFRALCSTVTPGMVRRSQLTAVLVGSVLFGVNSGDAVVQTGFTGALTVKLVVTMLIPFLVSLSSAAATRLEIQAASTGGPACANSVPNQA